MRKAIHAALAVSVITLTGFTASSVQAGPLKVVASFSIIADFAKNVGGERIDLTTLVGPNGDAHAFEPKPADAVAMAKADVVLVNGLHFEGFLQRLVEASATGAAVVELTKGVRAIEFPQKGDNEASASDSHSGGAHAGNEGDQHAHEDHGHGPLDPHAFQSIANAKIYVNNIAEAFCAADAEGCAAYRSNADAYTQSLSALEGEVRAAIASIPQDKRVVITSHDAFGYFAHEYGLTFLAPQGLSTEAEPSAADVARLVEQARHDKAGAIFVENITNPKLVAQIASETGLRVGGTLYSDSLSGSDGPAATYIDMMRSNVAGIKSAILGS